MNEIRDAYGRVVGFQCQKCFGVFPSMWGLVCNRCRDEERRHKELVAAIREGKKVEVK